MLWKTTSKEFEFFHKSCTTAIAMGVFGKPGTTGTGTVQELQELQEFEELQDFQEQHKL